MAYAATDRSTRHGINERQRRETRITYAWIWKREVSHSQLESQRYVFDILQTIKQTHRNADTAELERREKHWTHCWSASSPVRSPSRRAWARGYGISRKRNYLQRLQLLSMHLRLLQLTLDLLVLWQHSSGTHFSSHLTNSWSLLGTVLVLFSHLMFSLTRPLVPLTSQLPFSFSLLPGQRWHIWQPFSVAHVAIETVANGVSAENWK